MPVTPEQVSQNLRGYLEEVGANEGAPAGSHQTKIMKRDTHPRAQYDKATGELPELFLMPKIVEGQFERTAFPITLKWFAPEYKSEFAGGGKRTDDEMAQLAGMYRAQTVQFLQGIWGKDFSGSPVNLPARDDSVEEVYEVFTDIAKEIGDLEVRCDVSYRDGSDFANYKWTQVTGTNFSLGA